MNSTTTNFSASPKKEWLKPEVKSFELDKTLGGSVLRTVEQDTYYHT